VKRYLRDGLIYSVEGLRRLLGWRSRKRIITLHEVSEASQFRSKMIWLKETYEVLPLGDLLAVSPHPIRTQVAITFDDGYECWDTIAAPILMELKLPAVFFVCSGFIGTSRRDAKQFVRHNLKRTHDLTPLTLTQLQELASENLFEIGGHTAHHLNLGAIKDGEMLKQEIQLDRQQLERWTRTPIKWFAYPFGGPRHYSSESVDYLMKVSGYESAFTIVPGEVYQPHPFLIPRDSLDTQASNHLWSAWLNGSYDALYQLKHMV